MRLALALLVLSFCLAPSALAQTKGSSFERYLAAERSLQKHDVALAELASAVEEWLSGRQGVQATLGRVRKLRAQFQAELDLPSQVAASVRAAQDRMVSSVERFLAQTTPDASGQRTLFEALNRATHERAVTLLGWRTTQNQKLAKHHQSGLRGRYLAWESRWLGIWEKEVDITHRLQTAFLQTQAGNRASSEGFVRELLALQSQADKVATPPELANLSVLGQKRLTLLARAAEQLERVGSGSRGALTRLRKLNKEQAEMTRQLESQRLQVLAALRAP